MAPGTRVVSNSFRMGDWTPDQVVGNDQGYFWIVPAKVAGKWALSSIKGAKASSLELTQKYQEVSGSLVIDGKSQPIVNPKLVGDRLTFNFMDQSDQQRVAELTVNGKSFAGHVQDKSAPYALTGTLN